MSFPMAWPGNSLRPMPDGNDALAVQVISRIADVPAADWDACAGDNPFVRHAFTWAVILLPAPLLFHPPFLERVLLPGFAAL